MYKLGLEKAEEPEIELPTFVGSQRKQGNYRKTSNSASLTTLKPLTVWVTTNWKILKEMRISDHLKNKNTRPPPEKPVYMVKKQQLELDMEHQTGSKLGK